jgi:hypothetical protein
VTNLKVCSQKIVPIFLFFCLGRPEKLLNFALLADRKAFGTSPKGALWAENCPNFLAGKTEVFSGKVFSGKIEKIELSISLANDFVVPDNKIIKFYSTRQTTLLSQINTHLLPEEKRESHLDSLCTCISSYFGSN